MTAKSNIRLSVSDSFNASSRSMTTGHVLHFVYKDSSLIMRSLLQQARIVVNVADDFALVSITSLPEVMHKSPAFGVEPEARKLSVVSDFRYTITEFDYIAFIDFVIFRVWRSDVLPNGVGVDTTEMEG